MQTSSLLLVAVLVTVLSSVTVQTVTLDASTPSRGNLPQPSMDGSQNRSTGNSELDHLINTLPVDIKGHVTDLVAIILRKQGENQPSASADKDQPQPSVNNRQRRDVIDYLANGGAGIINCLVTGDCPLVPPYIARMIQDLFGKVRPLLEDLVVNISAAIAKLAENQPLSSPDSLNKRHRRGVDIDWQSVLGIVMTVLKMCIKAVEEKESSS